LKYSRADLTKSLYKVEDDIDDVEVKESMSYVVYVNHPSNRAMIHSTICGRLIMRRRDKTFNGYWSIIEEKPFNTIEEARNYAKKTGKRNIDTCAFCIK
jgi:hypothetical protein